MCDCYTAKCDGCGDPVEVHIGDYCVPRNCVSVYCPKPSCRLAAMDRLVGARTVGTGRMELGGWFMVFADTGAKWHDAYLFIANMPRGIHLNS